MKEIRTLNPISGLGNNTRTEYTYDAERRWLDSIKTQKLNGKNPVQSYQNIKYEFDRVGNVLWYENDCLDTVNGTYKTRQDYKYDDLYQLTFVEGNTVFNPYHSNVPEYRSTYTQSFEFDKSGLGNMMSKVSRESVTPHKKIGDSLNYEFDYVYDDSYAHRLVRAGERYYKYDSNGNVVCEQDGSFDGDGPASYHRVNRESDNVYSTDYGWGLFRDDEGDSGVSRSYSRTYTWNERNQMKSSVDERYNTSYVYGQDGQRSNKYTASSETLYFNRMWTHHTDSGNGIYGGQTAKNIFLGETRIVTKLNSADKPEYQEEYWKQYYYHSDHLGSASLITDYKGDEYQRIEYTPYGETWVEKTDPQTNLNFLPYKFTAKEMDEETGLYYYGARYMDSRYSRWISTDPALGEYIPGAGKGKSKDSGSLPGMGGVYNHINFHLYHYAGNNPVRYNDPTGLASVTNDTGDTVIVKPEDSNIPYTMLENGAIYNGKIDGIIFADGTVKKTSGDKDYVAKRSRKDKYVVSGGEIKDFIGNNFKLLLNTMKAAMESFGVDTDKVKVSILGHTISFRGEDFYGTYKYGKSKDEFLNSWLNTEKKLDINNDKITDIKFIPIPCNSDGVIPGEKENLERWNLLLNK